jgi:hypothetical protein
MNEQEIYKAFDEEYGKLYVNKSYKFCLTPEYSDWNCHLFGAEENNGISYRPLKGQEPNWFVRWMMKICFACTWVKDKK